MSSTRQYTARDHLPSAAATALQRSKDARTIWRHVMFEMPKLAPVGPEQHEVREADARREMIQADIDLFRLEQASPG